MTDDWGMINAGEGLTRDGESEQRKEEDGTVSRLEHTGPRTFAIVSITSNCANTDCDTWMCTCKSMARTETKMVDTAPQQGGGHHGCHMIQLGQNNSRHQGDILPDAGLMEAQGWSAPDAVLQNREARTPEETGDKVAQAP